MEKKQLQDSSRENRTCSENSRKNRTCSKNSRQVVVADLNGAASIVLEAQTLPGVRRIAEKVAGDVALVTGERPEIIGSENQTDTAKIYVGTLRHSSVLRSMVNEGCLDLTSIEDRRECYLFQVISWKGQDSLVIAGSDKRGTIYGLFHLSELMGVSPLVHFADVMPVKRPGIIVTEADNMVSHEPSVKYRGFFINDEWPAFGNWTCSHFEGFTAKMYDLIFETLLRMKGNYLWPAMWTSSFSLDGPGEASAVLADEYGVVMSNSHHEPCLRHSEEWDLVRGEDSIYGNEWNYYTNEEGLKAYWRDGLKRSGKYENIITVGMRGERDSSMLGEQATRKENIDLLKDIISAQNHLIRQCVNADLNKVPRMIALYKEVEAYFYGDKDTEGLKDWEGLDGITCMLCEDNFGNMRTLPPEELKDRNGGWGMYYHMDYHGGPVSYEWVNSSYIPKIWHQMSQAYEAGIRDIWIVNVGDVKFQEYPLSFFMDLAYDYEKWGAGAQNVCKVGKDIPAEYQSACRSCRDIPAEYQSAWLARQFGGWLSEDLLAKLETVTANYTRLGYRRKPEVMRAGIYHPVEGAETKRILAIVDETEALLEELKQEMPEELYPAFFELIYYPAAGSMNVYRMQLMAGLNQWYATIGATAANEAADEVGSCLKKDEALTEELDHLLDGKWSHMGQSEHIGFVNWNDEGCLNPVQIKVNPARRPRILAHVEGSGLVTSGGDWTGRHLRADGFIDPDVQEQRVVLLNGSKEAVPFTVAGTSGIMDVSEIVKDPLGAAMTSGVVKTRQELVLKRQESTCDQQITIQYEGGHIVVDIMYKAMHLPKSDRCTFVDYKGVVAIEAEHYSESRPGRDCSLMVLENYGRTKSALGIFPLSVSCTLDTAPVVSYQIYTDNPDQYGLQVYSAPANPGTWEGSIQFGLSVNKGEPQLIDIIPPGYQAGECSCREWMQMVLDQIRITTTEVSLKDGMNTIEIYPLSPNFLLERLVLTRKGVRQQETYLGPMETYHIEER